MMNLTFLGAAGTVTGSKYLLTSGTRKLLIDCGLFQGVKELRQRNWLPLSVHASEIDAVVLTHAHLDHSGYLPLLVRNGFAGCVFSSAATRALSALLLADSGHLQEEDAAYANKRRFSKHQPAKPLYGVADAHAALGRFTPIEWEKPHYLGGGFHVRLYPAGHILGAALVHVTDGDTSILFSGDLGRPNDPITVAPAHAPRADYLVVESTYGNRVHQSAEPEKEIAEVVRRTAARGGVVVVPAFAVGRAQTLLFYIQRLKRDHQIPDVPVFLNSPMAADVTDIFCEYRPEHRLDPATCQATCNAATFVRDVEESRALNARRGPMIIISASGMLTGGRVLHHLKAFAPDPRNTILLVGYQGEGTRGAALVQGAKSLRIHGEDVRVAAEVVQLSNLSAHADAPEIVDWLRGFDGAPKTTFITHGEPAASQALQERIERELGWKCKRPELGESVNLDAAASRSAGSSGPAVVDRAAAGDPSTATPSST